MAGVLALACLMSCSGGKQLFRDFGISGEARTAGTPAGSNEAGASENKKTVGDGSLAAPPRDSRDSQEPSPSPEVSDAPALIPTNIAGAHLFECATLVEPSDSAGHLVCAAKKGEIKSAYVLDANRDVLRDHFVEFSALGRDRLISTRLPGELFKHGARVRVTVEFNRRQQAEESELVNLPEFPVGEGRSEISKRLEDLSNLNTFENGPLNPECSGTLRESTMQFVVGKRDSGSCFWDTTKGDIAPNRDRLTASIESFGSEPSGASSLCAMHISINQPNFYYNDSFVLAVQNRIVAASFGKSWSFNHVTMGFPLYRKAEIIGRFGPDELIPDATCFGIKPPLACQVPEEASEDSTLLVDLELPVGKIRHAPQVVDWAFAVFGDNDRGIGVPPGFGSEVDCRHSGLTADIKVWKAESK